SPEAAAAARAPLRFDLDAPFAISAALGDLRGSGLAEGEVGAPRPAEGGYLVFPVREGGAGPGIVPGLRARQVLFHLPDRLQPAWYVEVGLGQGSRSDRYAYVISAADGGLLFRKDLVAADAYTYRVW